MSSELRPLKVEETYDHHGLKYGLDSDIYHKAAEFDVAVWWMDYGKKRGADEEEDSEELDGATQICVPNQAVLEMLSLHLEMNYSEALDITGAHILWIHETLEDVKKQLAAIRIPEPTDYLAVVKYIKETPQRKFDVEEVTVAAQ